MNRKVIFSSGFEYIKLIMLLKISTISAGKTSSFMKFFTFWYNSLPLSVDGPVSSTAVDCPGDATDAMATDDCTLPGKMK